MSIEELDTVRIVQLLRPHRQYDGTEGAQRPPRVGDTGAVVHINGVAESYTVECVDSKGYTVWLADFCPEELTVQEKFKSDR